MRKIVSHRLKSVFWERNHVNSNVSAKYVLCGYDHAYVYILGILLKKNQTMQHCSPNAEQLLLCYYINFSPSSNLLNLFRFVVCVCVCEWCCWAENRLLKKFFLMAILWMWLVFITHCFIHDHAGMSEESTNNTYTKITPWTHFDPIVRWNIRYLLNDVKSGRLLSMKLTKVHSTDIQVTSIL